MGTVMAVDLTPPHYYLVSSLQLVGGLLFFLSSLRLKRNWQLMHYRIKKAL
jgi:hypothetical protein